MGTKSTLIAATVVAAVGVSGLAFAKDNPTPKHHAKSTLRGPRGHLGHTGPKGDRGPQGPAGHDGAAGLVDWSHITVRHTIINSFRSTGTTQLQAACLPGEHVLTGGVSVQGGTVTTTQPLYANAGADGKEDGWAAAVEPDGAISQFADVMASCVRP